MTRTRITYHPIVRFHGTLWEVGPARQTTSHADVDKAVNAVSRNLYASEGVPTNVARLHDNGRERLFVRKQKARDRAAVSRRCTGIFEVTDEITVVER